MRASEKFRKKVGLQAMAIVLMDSYQYFDKLEINRGQLRMQCSVMKDATCINNLNQEIRSGLRRRSNLRSMRKGFDVASEGKEGEIWGSGRFHA